MTGNSPDRFFNVTVKVPMQISVLAILWVFAIGLQVVAGLHGRDELGRWAIMADGALASWTAILGVRFVMCKTAMWLVERFEQQLEQCQDGLADEVAERVVKRLELKALEAQVAALVPKQRV